MSSVVPEGWSKNTINECCEILDSQRVPINSEERAKRKGNYPYYGANGVQGYIDDYIFDGDAILLAEDGGNFEQYADRPIAQWVTGKFWVNNHAHILRAKENASDKWIFYSLVHKNILKNINGGTRAKLNQSDLKEIEILLPPISEQKRIISILTSVDEVIESTQKQIDKLQDLKKATMNELLTKGIGHTEFKDSELGRIPKSWEVAQIGDVTSFSQGIQVDVEQHHETKDDSKVRFVRISDYTKLDETPRYIDSALALKGLVEKDDVVMIRYGEAGRVCRGIVGAIANNLFTIRPSPRLLKDYLYYYCASEEIRSKVEALSASSAMPAVSFSSLRTLKLKIPPVDEQDLIVSAISSLDGSIEIHSQKLSQTQSLKKSLMQDLLTGKVRVTVN